MDKEYYEFEGKHLQKLTDLWYKTHDEDLRNIILEARKVLTVGWQSGAYAQDCKP